MVQSAYVWHGPFRYHTNGSGFEYKGKWFPIERYEKERRAHFALPDPVYNDDELYARFIRCQANTQHPSYYQLEIFDELPDGWRLGIDDGRFGWGLRGSWDRDSKYLWCENGPMYLNRYPGDSARNPNYKQALVRRK